MTAERTEEAASPGISRRLTLYVLIFAIGAAGLWLKRPFGEYLFHLLGKPVGEAPKTVVQWLMGDTASLILVALGCLLHARSGLPGAPLTERILFKSARTGPRPVVFRSGLLGALTCVGIFAASQVYNALNGVKIAISSGLDPKKIPHDKLQTLMMLYPLAFVGAALSEEVIFRFGMLSVLMGLMGLARVGGKPNNPLAFWIANLIQAAWFGYVHVAQGVVASQQGGLALALLVAPQTWSGVVFGYVFRRFGLEAAIVAHMLTDILVPLGLAALGFLLH